MSQFLVWSRHRFDICVPETQSGPGACAITRRPRPMKLAADARTCLACVQRAKRLLDARVTHESEPAAVRDDDAGSARSCCRRRSSPGPTRLPPTRCAPLWACAVLVSAPRDRVPPAQFEATTMPPCSAKADALGPAHRATRVRVIAFATPIPEEDGRRTCERPQMVHGEKRVFSDVRRPPAAAACRGRRRRRRTTTRSTAC